MVSDPIEYRAKKKSLQDSVRQKIDQSKNFFCNHSLGLFLSSVGNESVAGLGIQLNFEFELAKSSSQVKHAFSPVCCCCCPAMSRLLPAAAAV